MTDFDQIASALSSLGRRLQRATVVEVGLWCAAALLFSLGISVLLAQVGWVRVGVGAFIVAAVGAAVMWAILVRRGAVQLRERFALGTASLAEELAPELGTSATSAVDLARQLEGDDVSFSRELARAHLHRTSDALAKAQLEARLYESRRKRRRWATIGVAGAALWGVVLVSLLTTGRSRLATLLLNPGAARLSDVPLAGDIRITYRYPAYTGLQPRVVEGGDGSISAVVGTEVEISAVADAEARQAQLKLEDLEGAAQQDVPMEVDGRNLNGRLSVLRDGRYRFALVTEDGERLEDRQRHAVRAVPDAYPEVHLDEPSVDVELKDDQEINILWRATDDFGVGEVNLVVEPDGAKEPIKVPLSTAGETDPRLEGRYHWMVSELKLNPGTEARFYIEAYDTDTIGGPKKSVSTARRLLLFSARANHEKILARQQEIVDALIDWLGSELVAPFPQTHVTAENLAVQRSLLEQAVKMASNLVLLVADMREDKLSPPEITAAFENILEHVNGTRAKRAAAIEQASRPNASQAQWAALTRQQAADVAQLEKDVIYLDDLLAIQRIDELKETAKDLLAAQRSLQDLLQDYKQTQDPAVRAELEQRINDLRQKMLDLLEKMASIKDQLPGEYRNLESASMLEMGDQLSRLEQMLREGNLDAAAAELEQLANMIEGMMDSINDAEEEYGGERYAEMREQLAEFAQKFKELEDQQQALSQRTQDMLADYRKKSIERAGKDLDDFVEKAREKTAEALQALDELAEVESVFSPRDIRGDMQGARQRLLDLDALLEHRDFAEAREMIRQALQHERNVQSILDSNTARYRQPNRELEDAAEANGSALRSSEAVKAMLDKLFPDPGEVLSPEQMNQMQRMAQKQQELERQAQELGQQMDGLAGEMPLFGGEPRASLEGARQEMGQARERIGEGQLPRAAGHEERAVEQLGKLRQALEQASQRSGGKGLPLPLGGAMQGGREGQGRDNSTRDVEIPKTDPNRSGAELRESLREASKQKAPENYEEAVQRYYRELIR